MMSFCGHVARALARPAQDHRWRHHVAPHLPYVSACCLCMVGSTETEEGGTRAGEPDSVGPSHESNPLLPSRNATFMEHDHPKMRGRPFLALLALLASGAAAHLVSEAEASASLKGNDIIYRQSSSGGLLALAPATVLAEPQLLKLSAPSADACSEECR